MSRRLIPALLFASAAALYWLGAFVVLRLILNDPTGGECGAGCAFTFTFGWIAGPLIASVLSAAFVASEFGPLLAERLGHGRYLGGIITFASGVIAIIGFGVWIAGVDGRAPSLSHIFELSVVGLPFIMTAFPFGWAAAYFWRRSLRTETGSALVTGVEHEGDDTI